MSEDRGAESDATDTLPELEVFVVGRDGRLHGEEQDTLPTALEIVRMVRDAARDVQAQARADRALAAAHRPGPAIRASHRKGAGDTVIHAVLADPEIALSALLDGAALAPPIGRLRLDADSRVVDHRGITWRATVRLSATPMRRRARLRIYPSPSTNVTFMELLPERPRRRASDRFVRSGVRIVETLGNRLLSIAGPPTRGGSAHLPEPAQTAR